MFLDLFVMAFIFIKPQESWSLTFPFAPDHMMKKDVVPHLYPSQVQPALVSLFLKETSAREPIVLLSFILECILIKI